MKPEVNNSLSDYEIKILALLLNGDNVKSIAHKLGKRPSSMYNIVNRIHLLFDNDSKCPIILKYKYDEYLKTQT